MEGPRFSYESLGHFVADNGIRQSPAYPHGLGTLSDPAIDSALAELFSDSPRGLPAAHELATEVATGAPTSVLPPVIDFGMFQAAQYSDLLGSDVSSRPQRLGSESAAQPTAQSSGMLQTFCVHSALCHCVSCMWDASLHALSACVALSTTVLVV